MSNKNTRKKGFKLTIDNGIGLIICGLLLHFLFCFALWLVPICLLVLGISQIMRGHSKEGVPTIAIAGAVFIVGKFAGHLIRHVIVALVIIGIIVLIISILGRKGKKR